MTSIDQQAPATGFNMTLTERAAEEVRKFIAQEQVPPETAGLRVSVLPGGCSGFKYSLNIEERAAGRRHGRTRSTASGSSSTGSAPSTWPA